MKIIYHFNQSESEGGGEMINLLGGKGANLCEMTKIGLPVPPGLIITTEECLRFYKNNKKIDDILKNEVRKAIARLEKETNKTFGGTSNPLLLSVRSGSRFSMPGMMDTILNIGINESNISALNESYKNSTSTFALDCYRRFIQMYGNVVMDVPMHNFEEAAIELKLRLKIKNDDQVTFDYFNQIIPLYIRIIDEITGKNIPSDPYKQLFEAIEAVFLSWTNKRAEIYRSINNIPENFGTAVNIQTMVFGNNGENSATGVVFTRNPVNGKNNIFGEYLINAQGEDVVSGIKTPQYIIDNPDRKNDLSNTMPKCFTDLTKSLEILEKHYRAMQDVEFTIENNKLWLLQTRNGKRSPVGMVKIAHDMANEGLITKEEAIERIDCQMINKLLHPYIAQGKKYQIIASGLPASPGVASGAVSFSAEKAEEYAQKKQSTILVRHDTSPEDIGGMNAASGILTAQGGTTSHAAVVARGMGKCCISGCTALNIDYLNEEMKIGNLTIKQGDIITIDGNNGEVILGEVELVTPEFSEEFKTLIKWAKGITKFKIRANAETVKDAIVAINFGAQGIGLCRTEHMFFEIDRINNFRYIILAPDSKERNEKLDKIKEMQKKDFLDLFKVMNGLPINIRLLDPPLHEFLPCEENEIADFAKISNISLENVKYRIKQLKEVNPMLGHRGSRLGITCPEIYKMQIEAIFSAYNDYKSQGKNVALEIMLPMIIDSQEVTHLKKMILEVKNKFEIESGMNIDFKLGIMIETPRACLIAKDLAKHVDYFSFGTNDLTQSALAISRDDAAKFIPSYQMNRIIENDPFATIDKTGVGKLMEMAINLARDANPNIIFGICGEHGGDENSIEFFNQLNINYSSCSPYRISAATIAAAKASIKIKKDRNQSLTQD